MEQLLSVVKRRMEIRFLIMLGDTKTSLRTRLRCGKEKIYDTMVVTGSCTPLPTMIDGVKDDGGEMVERLPVSAVMWEPAPESAYHSEEVAGGLSVMVLNECARES
jgi:hypothetical protein